VAGLEKADQGEIQIGGTIVGSPSKGIYVPTEKRDIGMVFQSYAIWPHMNVFQNVAFPLIKGRRQIPRNQVADKVRHALKLVQLNGLEERPATDLSRGQQQREAVEASKTCRSSWRGLAYRFGPHYLRCCLGAPHSRRLVPHAYRAAFAR